VSTRSDVTVAADRADSAAERLTIKLLREAGVSGWVHGRPFGPSVIDFAFPGARVAVEVDGWAWHMDVERFRAGRHEGNARAGDVGPAEVHLARPHPPPGLRHRRDPGRPRRRRARVV